MLINFETMDDFHQTISTRFFNALAVAPPSKWRQIATEIASSSSRNTYPFIGELDDMREWIGPRIIRQLEAHRYAIENRKFELTLKAEVDQISDDNGGAVALYGSRAEIMGRSVALQPDQMMFREVVAMDPSESNNHSILCYDGQNFYDTDHPVGDTVASNDMGGAGAAWYLLDTSKPLKPFIYQNREAPVFAAMTDFSNPHVFMLDQFVWGAKRRNAGGYGLWQSAVRSKQTLDGPNLRAAWERMNSFTNDEGRSLGMNPDLLVVGQSNRFVAADLLDLRFVSDLVGSAAGGNTTVENKMYKKIDVLVSEWLP